MSKQAEDNRAEPGRGEDERQKRNLDKTRRKSKKYFVYQIILVYNKRNRALMTKKQKNCRTKRMDHYEIMNDVLVKLFNEILDIEEKALITGEYSDISVNDMHIFNAIGVGEKKNMSTVARALSVTVGTLTIAVNNLVKKGYVIRTRSEEDRRVVLISLSPRGEKAYYHHRAFHDKMILAVLKDLNAEETEVLTGALVKLRKFFRSYLE